ncbi:hypothetical protein DB88DRAFT_486258 [Papiliotrema laurentii]|uniref:F-box domain-containing protein n=1 Tax=Papiliotrema laurentii TaxID=5418 RepID=A0AAD9FR26_PAPLA|nr:hypothetical protein DB88DRAFT_486258 [Papiliotrema laurentii]
MSTRQTPSASSRFTSNNDVLAQVVEYLDDSSLHPFLRCSKAFAANVLPRLYRTLHLDPSKPSPFLLQSSPTHLSTCPPLPWTQSAAWEYVQTLSIPTHGAELCFGLHGPLPDLPRLHTIHLSGGDRTLQMGKECAAHSCPLLQRYGSSASLLILRKLHLLPTVPVTSALLILRPCQFPFESRGEPVVVAGTFRPLTHLDRIDLVLWDERHAHRIEWIDHQAPHFGRWPPGIDTLAAEITSDAETESLDSDSDTDGEGGWGSSGRPVFRCGAYRVYGTKGCHYCDQRGCVRYSPNIPKQLGGMLYTLARYTPVKEINVWNADKSLTEFQWWDSRMSLDECHEMAREQVRLGREEREAEMRSVGDGQAQEGCSAIFNTSSKDKHQTASGPGPSHPVDLHFGDSLDWTLRVKKMRWQEHTAGEEGYWPDSIVEADVGTVII